MRLSAAIGLQRGALALDVALDVGDEVVAVVGPNGAGKTTLLAALAGLVRLERGRIALGDRCLADAGAGVHVAPAHRRIGVVFQDYLLFAHLTVLDNVAFGLRAAGRPAREARREAMGWLERVGLADRAAARPAQLSGGQAQRVALVRALAVGPQALLLDEPLAALDVDARHDIRRILREHLDRFAGPAVLVTHDPVEAATLADRLVVLEGGRVTQAGTIDEITRRPRSDWAARLAGVNLYRGTASAGVIALPAGGHLVAADRVDGAVHATVAPQAVALYRQRPDGTPRNVWPVEVAAMDTHTDRVRVHLTGRPPVTAEVTPAAAAALDLAGGGPLWATVKATEVRTYPA